MPMGIIAQNKRTTIICPKTIQLCRYINIDEISILEYFVCPWCTMRYFVVNADTGMPRKLLSKHWCRNCAETAQHACTKLVQLLCRHTHTAMFAHGF